jgi:amidohydrolase
MEHPMPNLEQIWKSSLQQANWIIEQRRMLHRIPELGFNLPRTSTFVRDRLDELGISYRYPIATSGIVADLGRDGPCVALRADMDALPIHEQADVDFRSEIPGQMHACGHDCHTAMLLGAAKILKESEHLLPGRVRLIFQPAEETGGGAARMVAEGVLDQPKVQRIFGIHVWPFVETGVICGREGTFLAAVTSFHIVVKGKGGHGAFPHTTRDPIAATTQIINAIQTVVSRESNPVQPSVVSVTKIKAGTAYNIIPDQVEFGGTIRALTIEHLESIRVSVNRLATEIAAAMRCTASMSLGEGEFDYPPTVNSAHCWHLAQDVAREYLSEANVLTIDPVMGAEDFSFYTSQADACFIALGVRNEAIGAIHEVHNCQFKVDENALAIGTAMHVGFALRSLAELAS